MMVRTQILLDAEEHRRAKLRAAELGISLAEYIRRVVGDDLATPAAKVDASEIIGLFGSGGSDIARHKDAYLAEALETKVRAGVTRTGRRR
jgi:hypothetical protein